MTFRFSWALVVPIVSLATSAWAQSPALSPARELPGDALVSLSTADQSSVSLSAGGGGFLAVWTDRRAQLSSLGASPETGLDVWGIRLDANGTPIDAVAFPILRLPGDDTAPRATWNGSSWLVTWTTQSTFDSIYDSALVGARVSAGGVVLDAAPIPLAGEPFGTVSDHAVASDGNGWLVVTWGAPSNGAVLGVRLDAQGHRLDANPLTLMAHPQFAHAYSLAYAQGVYLLAWSEWRTATMDDVFFRRFDVNLQSLDATPVTLTASTWNDLRPRVVSNGATFLVAWSHDLSSTLQSDVRVARVMSSGVVVDPASIPVSGNRPYGASGVDAAWDGSQWYVVWKYDGLELARVATNGSVLDVDGFPFHPGAPKTQASPALAGSPLGGVHVAFVDDRAGSYEGLDVYGARVVDAAIQGPDVPVSIGLPAQTSSDVVGDGTGYAIAFRSETSGVRRLLVSRTDASGVALDPQPIEVTNDPLAWAPSIAWDGVRYLIVWSHGPSPTSSTNILGRRLAANGTWLDAVPFTIGAGSTPRVAGHNGEFLVAWARGTASYPLQQYTSLVLVRGSDGFVQGPPALVNGTFAAAPDVCWIGTRWLVAWHRNYSVSDMHGDVNLCFVDANGVPTSSSWVAGDYGSYNHDVRVAASGNEAMIAWVSGTASNGTRRVQVRRVRDDGTFLDTVPILLEPGVPGERFAPAVTWDGTQYLVVHQDHRHGVGSLAKSSDVYGVRVGADGTVLDSQGFLIERTSESECAPSIEGLTGARALFASSRTSPTAGAYRIAVRVFDGTAAAPAPYCVGKTTSLGAVPTIGHTGSASIGANDLYVNLIQAVPNAPAILFHGGEAFAQPFLGGTLCVRPPLVRGVVQITSPAGTAFRFVGADPADLGVTRCFQWFTRDAAQIDGTGASLSNALQVTFAP